MTKFWKSIVCTASIAASCAVATDGAFAADQPGAGKTVQPAITEDPAALF